MNNSCGNANGRCIFGNIGEDDGIGADLGAISDSDGAEDFRAGADVHVVAKNGHVVQRLSIADGHALPNRAVFADYHTGTYDDCAKMIDAQSAANRRTAW